MSDSPQALPGIFLRGALMGAADIVPGVSGGTMAFITGIYARLIDAITAFDFHLLPLLLRREWRAIWQRVDGAFLLALVAGIATSVFTLANLISWLLTSQPLLLWSFFFGLILASALVLLRHIAAWTPAAVLGCCGGALAAAFIGLSPAFPFPEDGPLSFFLAGFVAICAMILPGVSGSFLLVLLGMYARLLAAIDALLVLPLLSFAAGAVCGLLAFSRLLRYLLAQHHGATLATLTGFLVGSLPVVWPWKLNAPATVPARPVWPSQYAAEVAASQPGLCILLMLIGLLVVWLLESRWGGAER
jgi:putative membrane protein